jgi:aerobic carbon-monoxide dehydrogenase medium subunit
MIPANFEYLLPESLEEAISLLHQHGDEAKLLAGGQSLVPLMKLRLATPAYVVDLGRIPGLSFIEVADGGRPSPQPAPQRGEGVARSSSLRIGALTPYVQLQRSELLQQVCPLLPQTTSVVADTQVRNRGTIGGSLAHADPTGDMPAAILALGAELKAVGENGERWIGAEDFFEGVFSTSLAEDEILTEVRVPTLEGWGSSYLKMAPHASGFAVVGVAACVRRAADGTCEDVRLAVTAVGEKPYRAHSVEDALRGQPLDAQHIGNAVSTVTEGQWVVDDVRATAEYRTHLAGVYAQRAIFAAVSGALAG